MKEVYTDKELNPRSKDQNAPSDIKFLLKRTYFRPGDMLCYSKTIVIFPNDIVKMVVEISQLKGFHFIHLLKMKNAEPDDTNTF